MKTHRFRWISHGYDTISADMFTRCGVREMFMRFLRSSGFMDAHRIHIVDGESLNDNIDGAYLCLLVSVFFVIFNEHYQD